MIKYWTVEELLANGIGIVMGDRIQVDVNDPYALIEINEEEGVAAWNEIGHKDNPSCIVVHFADRWGAVPEGTEVPLLVDKDKGSWKPVPRKGSPFKTTKVKKISGEEKKKKTQIPKGESKLLVGVHEKPAEVTIVFADEQGSLVMFANGDRTYVGADDPTAKLINKVGSEREILLRKLLSDCSEVISPNDMADYLISKGLFEDL